MKMPAGFTAAIVSASVLSAGLVPASAAPAAPLPTATISPTRAQVDLRGDVAAGSKVKLTVLWGLKRREAGALAAFAAVSTPSSPAYRHFQSAASIRGYGATKATVTKVKRKLRGTGLTLTVDKSGVFARVKGSQAAWEKFTKRKWILNRVNGDYEPKGKPKLPKRFKGLVQPIWAGLVKGPMPNPFGGKSAKDVGTRSIPAPVPLPANTGTPISACSDALNPPGIFPGYAMTYQQAAVAYGIDDLQSPTLAEQSARDLSIAMVGSGWTPQGYASAAQCMEWTGAVATKLTGGLTKPIGSKINSGESDLDVQSSSAIIRNNAKIVGLQSVGNLGVGIPNIAAAVLADPQRASILSISYGQCEAEYKKLYSAGNGNAISVADSMFVRLGLAGVSVLVAAGDSGSSSCSRSNLSQWQPAVSYPASSPYVTAVGGTRLVLDAQNQRTDEVVWNDYAYQGGMYTDVLPNYAAGGGGVSGIYGRPSWQQGVAPELPAQRIVPDIAAHASGGPAWLIKSSEEGQPIWTETSGTSAATPVTAAAIALIIRQQRAGGQPGLGFLNPWLYGLSAAETQSAFYDVTQGSNSLFESVPCCNATPGYDAASGFGVLEFGNLAQLVRPVG